VSQNAYCQRKPLLSASSTLASASPTKMLHSREVPRAPDLNLGSPSSGSLAPPLRIKLPQRRAIAIQGARSTSANGPLGLGAPACRLQQQTLRASQLQPVATVFGRLTPNVGILLEPLWRRDDFGHPSRLNAKGNGTFAEALNAKIGSNWKTLGKRRKQRLEVDRIDGRRCAAIAVGTRRAMRSSLTALNRVKFRAICGHVLC